jgi:hypothetical protein
VEDGKQHVGRRERERPVLLRVEDRLQEPLLRALGDIRDSANVIHPCHAPHAVLQPEAGTELGCLSLRSRSIRLALIALLHVYLPAITAKSIIQRPVSKTSGAGRYLCAMVYHSRARHIVVID